MRYISSVSGTWNGSAVVLNLTWAGSFSSSSDSGCPPASLSVSITRVRQSDGSYEFLFVNVTDLSGPSTFTDNQNISANQVYEYTVFSQEDYYTNPNNNGGGLGGDIIEADCQYATNGGASATTTVSTASAPDTTPNAFTFTDVGGASLSTLYTSNQITVSGINAASAISISGGSYSINGGSYTTSSGTVTNGQTVTVRLTSSGSYSTTASATLTIGGVSDTYSVTTGSAPAGDTDPDQFYFSDATNASLSTYYESNQITVTGINQAANLSVSNAQYSINGGGWSSSPTTITNGSTVKIRVLSSGSYQATTQGTLQIGSISAAFNVTTQASSGGPNAFGWESSYVPTFGLAYSKPVTISGLTTGVTISIANGLYSINGGGFTSSAGTIYNGDYVILQANGPDVNATLTVTVWIGSGVGTWTMTGRPHTTIDLSANPFSFTPTTNAALNTQYTSGYVTISGLEPAGALATCECISGQIQINSGPWISPSTIVGVASGDQIRARLTTSNTYNTPHEVIVIVNTYEYGGENMVTGTWTVTTGAAPDSVPDQFYLTDITGADLDTVYTSNPITVTGINQASSISISGGTYSINNGSYVSTPGTVVLGDVVRVRLTSSSSVGTALMAFLYIGGVSEAYAVTTAEADSYPNSFSFDPVNGANLNTTYTSNQITISGINVQTPISISGGEYSINGGGWTSNSGYIYNGQTLRVRIVSSALYSDMKSLVVYVGDFYTFFVTTTAAQDSTPNQFYLTDVPSAALSTLYTSNDITVTGINTGTPITIDNATYSINGGAYTSSVGVVYNNDIVRLRMQSSSGWSVTTNATLNIGGVSDVWSITTISNTQPSPFTFTDITGASLNTVYTSNQITISGITSAASISITGGEFSINGGAYRTTSTTITNNSTVTVRVTSSGSFSTAVSATLNVGGTVDTYSVTTLAADSTPDAFTFGIVSGATLSQTYTSSNITVSGLNTTAAISITNGEYAINNGSFVTSSGTITNGQLVKVRGTAPSTTNQTKTITLTIGGVSGTYAISTGGDAVPDQFSFTNRTGVSRNSVQTSSAVTITGISVPASVSISAGGTYSIAGGAYTSNAGTITNGQTIAIRQTSSPNFSTATSVTLTIGGVTSTWTVTTGSGAIPDQFTFNDVTGAMFSTVYTSNPITLSGMTGTATATISGATFSVNQDVYSSSNQTVQNGDVITIRLVSSHMASTSVSATLTIGSISDTFTITTAAVDPGDNVPDQFDFGTLTGAALNSLYVSGEQTIFGLGAGITSPISVVGGNYSIDGGPWLTSASTVVNNSRVRLRVTSSGDYDTSRSVTANIGGVTGSFTVVTQSAPLISGANRVVFGNRNSSEIGIFVSKPGRNVLTASNSDLMFQIDSRLSQIIAQGSVSFSPNQTGTISIPIANTNGYTPIVAVFENKPGMNGSQAYLLSDRLTFSCAGSTLYVTLSSAVSYSVVASYIVMSDTTNG